MLGSDFLVTDLTKRDDIPDVEETGSTFLENATLKAISGSRHFEGLVFADDSGLEVDALHGAPGVRSARYSGAGATDARNLQLLLDQLRGITRRTARFRCVVVVAKGGEALASFDGTCEGQIIEAPAGGGGFGYDPVFAPVGYDQTFAELPGEQKNAISHRGKAVASAVNWLRGQFH